LVKVRPAKIGKFYVFPVKMNERENALFLLVAKKKSAVTVEAAKN